MTVHTMQLLPQKAFRMKESQETMSLDPEAKGETVFPVSVSSHNIMIVLSYYIEYMHAQKHELMCSIYLVVYLIILHEILLIFKSVCLLVTLHQYLRIHTYPFFPLQMPL